MKKGLAEIHALINILVCLDAYVERGVQDMRYPEVERRQVIGAVNAEVRRLRQRLACLQLEDEGWREQVRRVRQRMSGNLDAGQEVGSGRGEGQDSLRRD